MSKSRTLTDVEKAERALELARIRHEAARKRKTVLCGCGRTHQIGNLDLIRVQTLGIPKYNFWSESAWWFLCKNNPLMVNEISFSGASAFDAFRDLQRQWRQAFRTEEVHYSRHPVWRGGAVHVACWDFDDRREHFELAPRAEPRPGQPKKRFSR